MVFLLMQSQESAPARIMGTKALSKSKNAVESAPIESAFLSSTTALISYMRLVARPILFLTVSATDSDALIDN